MRLVDADLLEENMKDYQMDIIAKATAMHVIRNEPTAYDVEAVVENVYEIGRRFCNSVKCNKECQDCDHGVLIKTIVSEIKNGGVK